MPIILGIPVDIEDNMYSQACKLCPMAGIFLQQLDMKVLLPAPVTPMTAMNTSVELRIRSTRHLHCARLVATLVSSHRETMPVSGIGSSFQSSPRNEMSQALSLMDDMNWG